jgi:squalene-hopene/tetraprenyl-beta-curcumene cyclase
MAIRNLCLVSLVQGLLALAYSAPTLGGEYTPEQWDRTKASQYLDRRGEEWFNFGSAHRGQGVSKTSCVSCHSLLPLALARPVLRQLSNESVPSKLETRLLEQTKRRVANWDKLDGATFQLQYDFDEDKKKQSWGTESVLNALILSRDDRFQGRQEPSEDTKKALSILWATQITLGQYKGSWEWINFGMDPWEGISSRYFGAALGAIAVGNAPGNGFASTNGDAKQRLDSLRDYLRKNYAAQNLHNRVWMLWASSSLDGLLTPSEKDQLIEQLLAKQLASGGWSLASLGDFERKGVTSHLTTPDGYATGLILHVLQNAGLSKENPKVSKGLAWLRSNQDPTGAWRAASVNKNRAPESKKPGEAHVGKFMWDAATAYSVLALSH